MNTNPTRSLILLGFLLSLVGCQQKPIVAPRVDGCPATLNHTVRQLNAEAQVNLCKEYYGQVVLIVNTASKCAFTGQYEDLEALYARYKERGFVVLGFPSNDFANQEPGDEKQVQQFCRLTYDVHFPMFSKTRVRKGEADPVFQTLGELGKSYPKWNFYKYLLDRQGNLVAVYSSLSNPSGMTSKIEDLLNAPPPNEAATQGH